MLKIILVGNGHTLVNYYNVGSRAHGLLYIYNNNISCINTYNYFNICLKYNNIIF